MADISKCLGTQCNLKRICYRYNAPNSDFRQSWMTYFKSSLKTHENGDQTCTSLWIRDQKFGPDAHYCGKCKGITHSTVCENPSCPEQPCCGQSQCTCNNIKYNMTPANGIDCKYVKRIGESCVLNNNCKYPNCDGN